MTSPDGTIAQPDRPARARRSVLYVPASNARAMQKVAGLACDAVIFDLEDAVGPDEKASARAALENWFSDNPPTGKEYVIRVNALVSEWGPDDLETAALCRPDAILLPKVDRAGDILEATAILADLDTDARLWAMMETPLAIADAVAIAGTGNRPDSLLDCLVAGTNDLAKETGVALPDGRQFMQPWLMQIILAARTAGLDALDGVFNDFRDSDGHQSQCKNGRLMGFDGKTLIHPSQIEAANASFGASADEIAAAQIIVDAFAKPQYAGKGVIQLNGKMVERLHLEQAEKLLAKAALQHNTE
ncbi:MAG: CoA ester lyase [Hyphomicrobiales bacterium]|nr:CoA ester lyase [Hyphomicrobiales bacterium]